MKMGRKNKKRVYYPEFNVDRIVAERFFKNEYYYLIKWTDIEINSADPCNWINENANDNIAEHIKDFNIQKGVAQTIKCLSGFVVDGDHNEIVKSELRALKIAARIDIKTTFPKFDFGTTAPINRNFDLRSRFSDLTRTKKRNLLKRKQKKMKKLNCRPTETKKG